MITDKMSGIVRRSVQGGLIKKHSKITPLGDVFSMAFLYH